MERNCQNQRRIFNVNDKVVEDMLGTSWYLINALWVFTQTPKDFDPMDVDKGLWLTSFGSPSFEFLDYF